MQWGGKYQQKGVEHVVQKKLGQGKQERLHPGTPTFGHAFEGHQDESIQQSESEPGDAASGKSASEK